MLHDTDPNDIFDRTRRRALRERAGRRSDAFLWPLIADELSDRLVDVTRTFTEALVIGPMATYLPQVLRERGMSVTTAALSISEKRSPDMMVVEEDRLPFQPASFDLVMVAGTLDSVNDLPGALVQIRRVLRPDGLFLGHMFGAGSLTQLKGAMLDSHKNSAAPHIHPQIDLRSAADLLGRAGFAMPVADCDTTTVRYSAWHLLIDDLRDMGTGNALAGQRSYLGRQFLHALRLNWSSRAENDGKVPEQFVHLYMSGWAPSDEQPQPAKRGSATVSLASILGTDKSGD